MQWVSRRLVGVSLGAALCGTAACSHQGGADRAVERLTADIAKMQADRDRVDQRLGALEAAEQNRDAEQKAPSPRKIPAEPGRRLPVVHVGQGQADGTPLPPTPLTPAETPDLETSTGDPRPGMAASGSREGSANLRRQNDARAEGASPSLEAKRDYDAALSLARGKQYEKALQALTAFLVRHPDHPYADNAMYWRGECFYATGAYARAAEEFEGLIARFPHGNKVPDALLKLGLCQERLGSQELAQKTFAERKLRYPKSDAARQVPRP